MGFIADSRLGLGHGPELIVVIAGLFVGAVVGVLGGGGSVLTVPLLLYVMKLEPKTALATSQLVIAVVTAAAALIHARRRNVDFSTGAIFGATGMLGAYTGGRLAQYVPAKLLLVGFSGLIFISAIEMLRRKPAKEEVHRGHSLWASVPLGLGIGFLAGLLGTSGGFLIVPALTLISGLSMGRAIGTSLLVSALQSSAGAAGYLDHASVNFSFVAILAVATTAGSLSSSLFTPRLSAMLLRRLFAVLLFAIGALVLLRNLFPV